MEVSARIIYGTFSRIWANLGERDRAQKYALNEPPIRSELFSAEQMEKHGRALAGMHQLKPGHPRDRLLSRLEENESLLLEVHRLLTEDVKEDRRITPAGEWLLDNFYVI
jgi:cyclic beta-1,2-glucan synthetase